MERYITRADKNFKNGHRKTEELKTGVVGENPASSIYKEQKERARVFFFFAPEVLKMSINHLGK